MRCPYCSFKETEVVDSRIADRGDSVRRRRHCNKCGKRFTTYERTALIDLIVVKRDGRRESFDRSKLVRGLQRACQKRPVKVEKIEGIAYEIEKELRKEEKREIPARKVGDLVMQKLKEVDEVAYVRFASVYYHFKTAEQFAQEIEKLKKRK